MFVSTHTCTTHTQTHTHTQTLTHTQTHTHTHSPSPLISLAVCRQTAPPGARRASSRVALAPATPSRVRRTRARRHATRGAAPTAARVTVRSRAGAPGSSRRHTTYTLGHTHTRTIQCNEQNDLCRIVAPSALGPFNLQRFGLNLGDTNCKNLASVFPFLRVPNEVLRIHNQTFCRVEDVASSHACNPAFVEELSTQSNGFRCAVRN